MSSSSSKGKSPGSARKRKRSKKVKDEDDEVLDLEAASASRGKGKGKGKAKASPKDVFRMIDKLKKAMVTKDEARAGKTIKDLVLDEKIKEVDEIAEETLIHAIEVTMLNAVRSILAGNAFKFEVPLRSASNILYVPDLDRIVLKDKVSEREFTSTQTVKKVTIMTRVLQLIREVLVKRIHVTKRDLFYTDVKLFQDQSNTDTVLEDVACMLGCTRTSLHVVASEKGVVVGRLKFREDGDLIDCTKMGIGGKAIPPYIDRMTDVKSDAMFVLLVEKDAAFMRLAEDRFYNKYPCIILTAKGQPDVATRLFLRKLRDTLKIPVLGLVDSDPYGLKILSVYMSGSKNMSYDSASLTTRDIRWLGVRPSDMDKYNIPAQCRLKMTEEDIKTGKRLLEEEFIKKNPEWVKELQLMLKTKEKAEIQALSAYGFQYLTEEYLPRKLKDGDWV